LTASCPSDESTLDLKTLEAGWDTVSANVVRQAYEKFEDAIKAGKGREEALELCSQERFVAARVHTAGYMFRCVSRLGPPSKRSLAH
jgi:acyl-CoA oxidase